MDAIQTHTRALEATQTLRLEARRRRVHSERVADVWTNVSIMRASALRFEAPVTTLAGERVALALAQLRAIPRGGAFEPCAVSPFANTGSSMLVRSLERRRASGTRSRTATHTHSTHDRLESAIPSVGTDESSEWIGALRSPASCWSQATTATARLSTANSHCCR